MKSKWTGLLKVLIVIFMIILVFNAFALTREIRSDVSYKNRSYGLSVMDECFDIGEHYQIYLYTLNNKYVDEKPYVDVSQYEAFGRFYNAYLKAKMYPDNDTYLKQMQIEKGNVTFKKILNVISLLEDDLSNKTGV